METQSPKKTLRAFLQSLPICRCLRMSCWLIVSLSILLAACQEEETRGDLPEEPDTVLNLHIQAAEGQDLPEGNAHLFVFDANDLLTLHLPYPSLDVLLRAFKPTRSGSHTYLLVMGVGTGFDLPETRADLTGMTLSEFLKRLALLTEEYPDLSTGIVRVSLEEGRITQATLEMQIGIVRLATLGMELVLPEDAFLPYAGQAETRSVPDGYALRSVVEVWQPGGQNCLLHHTLPLTYTETASSPVIWLENLPLQACDIVLWVDHVPAGQTEDYHYATSRLRAVTFNPDMAYAAGPDTRNAYAARFSVNLHVGDTIIHTVPMKRPFARYRIVANDLQRYEQMRDVNGFPALEDIEVRAAYTSYFPCSYNVREDRPNDATLEQTYLSTITAATDSTVQLASDHIWVDLMDSSVQLSLALVDKQTGDTLSEVRNLDIPYRRGYLTTLSGDFLTAGKSSGSITVDERWDGEYNVEF